MTCFATPYGLRYAAHCCNRAHAQQSGSALVPAGGKLEVTSALISSSYLFCPMLVVQLTIRNMRGQLPYWIVLSLLARRTNFLT